MYLLDTNVVSELRKVEDGKADTRVADWQARVEPSVCFISAITLIELEIGVLRMEHRDAVQGAMLRAWLERRVLPEFSGRVLPVDAVVARYCARLHVPDPRAERDALIAAKAKPPARRLLSFVAASPDTPIAHGGELILRNGEPVGDIASAAYGHSVGGIVALGYAATGGAIVDDTWLAARFEIDIAGERVPVRASLRAPYDPGGEKLK